MMNKPMKLLIILLALSLTSAPFLQAGEPQTPASKKVTLALKQYMAQFGTMAAGIELMREKDKKPDWSIIQSSLESMQKTLEQMKAADTQKNYVEFTSVLDRQMGLLEVAAKQKNKKFYSSFDELLDTCFNCHKSHRPDNFLSAPQ